MKRFHIIVMLATILSANAFAQQTARERLTKNRTISTDIQKEPSIGVSTRAKIMNRMQEKDLSDAKWIRLIYRTIDLTKEKNAPLYYPVVPQQGSMNLFTLIFKLISEDKIAAYEYLDGIELFTPKYKIDFKELLDRFSISYENKNGKIVVSDVDIPSNEVLEYYLKEAYYFETRTSTYGVKPIAICPIIYRQGDYDAGTARYPLFWVSYDDLRPYAQSIPIMTSSINNAILGTIDDYFTKNSFEGDIYKATNSQNLAISQYTSTPEEVKKEQEKIENQLKSFEENLWNIKQDSTLIKSAKRRMKNRK